jgi:NADH-quinone oxidoreductase subunit J
MQLLIFYVFGFIAIFAAVSMIVVKQPVMSALFLILNMLCLAGLYALLDAHLIAAVQVIVYAGAIMVLVLFVIMLLNLREKKGLITRHKVAMQGIGVVIVSFVFVLIATTMNFDALSPAGTASAEFGTVTGVAKTLFTDFLLPFEIASVLLLVAIIGAVILSKSRT